MHSVATRIQDIDMHSQPKSAVTIRPCEESDIAAITEIYRHAVLHGTASFEIEPPSVDTMIERRQALITGGFPYLVAEVEGTVAGYAYAGAHRARPAYGATVEDSIYVDPDRKGLGIGKALLLALIDEATTRGFRQMVAVVGDADNAASIGVHRAAGFEMVGTLKSVGWKHGRWLDIVLMQRPLGEADTTPRF
ncbi:putative acetyltransferase [Agrobacterium rubi TR3 = NBRC 13261]|uniref:Putative acetyltransferase n=1 Tax=Agrobacterium rubi TR3 = NBRC 13261 TaxID=1368415 RepID=A0A081CYG6_9HYPH|nr:GNAT family N-acetyltransferase [Agrobacterium rubi]MBP1879935.1 phosphinothricin acetyltransferase [Agrobacterium rubi]MCL6653983.1 GCN5 family acetyltransferase [Agrobacterium rubi]GAK71712.1 putative acetyltransferase [Agrobacterium rubi TR3 = NBRC 13261]